MNFVCHGGRIQSINDGQSHLIPRHSPIELYSNNGSRVICKIKVKDFVDGIKDYKE